MMVIPEMKVRSTVGGTRSHVEAPMRKGKSKSRKGDGEAKQKEALKTSKKTVGFVLLRGTATFWLKAPP
jgi:hypothetical protein